MNIKELADIGANAVIMDCHHGRKSSICCNAYFGDEYEFSRKNREVFAQAVIDAYRKSVDEPAPAKDKWAAEKAARAMGEKIEISDGNGNWLSCNHPAWVSGAEYRIAPKPEETDDMLKKRVHELMAENTKLRQQLEVNKERQEFEQYALKANLPLQISAGFYENGVTYAAWLAWKAARKSK